MEARSGFEPLNKGFADLHRADGTDQKTNEQGSAGATIGPVSGQLADANGVEHTAAKRIVERYMAVPESQFYGRLVDGVAEILREYVAPTDERVSVRTGTFTASGANGGIPADERVCVRAGYLRDLIAEVEALRRRRDELLVANTAEVERRRAAEKECAAALEQEHKADGTVAYLQSALATVRDELATWQKRAGAAEALVETHERVKADLQANLTEARVDTVRLDWLESSSVSSHVIAGVMEGQSERGPIHRARGWRGRIDAARKGGAPEPVKPMCTHAGVMSHDECPYCHAARKAERAQRGAEADRRQCCCGHLSASHDPGAQYCTICKCSQFSHAASPEQKGASRG